MGPSFRSGRQTICLLEEAIFADEGSLMRLIPLRPYPEARKVGPSLRSGR